MRRIFYTFFITCFFICCKGRLPQSPEKTIYYPSKISFSDSTMLVRINLDDIKLNIKEIKDLINKIYENDSTPYIEFAFRDTLRKIIPLYNGGGGLIYERDALKITEDSIITLENNHAINELNRLIKLHYGNEGEIPYFSRNPQNAYIEIDIDSSKNNSALTKSLKNLISVFNTFNCRSNDTLKLNVALRQQNPPPPPLPPE